MNSDKELFLLRRAIVDLVRAAGLTQPVSEVLYGLQLDNALPVGTGYTAYQAKFKERDDAWRITPKPAAHKKRPE